VGTRVDHVVGRLDQFDRERWKPSQRSPFGRGDAATRIADIIEELPAIPAKEINA